MMSKGSSSNPMRISSESLDLDDIISDLNSSQNTISNRKQLELPSSSTQRGVAVAAGETAQAKSERQAIIQKQTKPLMKGGKIENKENDSRAVNRVQPAVVHDGTVLKPKLTAMSDAKETCHTVETKATTNEKYRGSESGNQRYGTQDSQFKSGSNLLDLNLADDDKDELRLQQVPFYMKQQMMNVNDEDTESFQRKLDTMIVNFRSETLSEFMKTKKQVLTDQAQTIDAERRRCNTLLGVKQNEIEQLKESLGLKTRLCDDLGTRCEGMAFWAGKSKTLLRIKLLQHQAFEGLKKYRDFKKHSKMVLQQKLRQFKKEMKRKVFLGWESRYKQWKIVKNREDFDRAVKLELQHICSQYNKEIESLRDRLNEAQAIVDSEHRTKAMMQEQLKKAFMRGVCALNFEAMNILNPNDQQQQIEKEMERQVINAMNSVALSSPFANGNNGFPTPNAPIFKSVSETFSPQSQSSSDLENAYHERKMIQIDGPLPNPFSQNIADSNTDYLKVESKDSMWRPAPVMGRDITQNVVPSFTYSHPTVTSQLKAGTQQNVVLSSHFTKLAQQSTINSDIQSVLSTKSTNLDSNHHFQLNEDTAFRVVSGNPTVIHNSSSLPDFVGNGTSTQPSGEGKTIIANNSKHIAPKTSSMHPIAVGKKPLVSSATSRKGK